RHIDPTETIWLRPTWELYERWCFIRILQLIRERADGCMVANRHGSLRTWRGHTASGMEILVFLQPRFPAFDNTSRNDFWSISREREPDIVIAVSTRDLHRFVVLDAKYRQCRTSVLDSMASAHIYHDSLRWGNRSPDSALLLVPAGGGAPWLEH